MAASTVILRPNASIPGPNHTTDACMPSGTAGTSAYTLVSESVADDDSTYVGADLSTQVAQIQYLFDVSALSPQTTVTGARLVIRVKSNSATHEFLYRLLCMSNYAGGGTSVSLSLPNVTTGTWTTLSINLPQSLWNITENFAVFINSSSNATKGTGSGWYVTQLYLEVDVDDASAGGDGGMFAKVDGSWKPIAERYKKVNGVWQAISETELKEILANTLAFPPGV